MRQAGHGGPVSVIAHGDHVAGVVPSGELDRLRETIEVLSGTELLRDLRRASPMRVLGALSAEQIDAGLTARRAAGE